jgi:hypothetical protein
VWPRNRYDRIEARRRLGPSQRGAVSSQRKYPFYNRASPRTKEGSANNKEGIFPGVQIHVEGFATRKAIHNELYSKPRVVSSFLPVGGWTERRRAIMITLARTITASYSADRPFLACQVRSSNRRLPVPRLASTRTAAART